MPTTISSALSSIGRCFLLALLAGGLAGISRSQAQTPVPSRITAPLDDKAVVSLRGNVHPLARAEFDHGAAPVSLPAERMLLILKRSPEQQQALTKYIASLQDPGSSSYHKFITPQDFGRLYGPSDADVQTVSRWLQEHGFRVNQVSAGRTTLEFSGNVGQVQDTFRTSIHSFVVRGEQHWANTVDPVIPAALAPVVAGLSPLNNFTARPNSVRGPSATYDVSTRKTTPLLTNSSGNTLFVGPADAATIYNTPNSKLNANSKQLLDGTGITIAIAGDSNIDSAIVDRYRSRFGLPANTPTVIIDGNDPGVGGDEDEALLDLEIAGGLAPGAKVILYAADNTTFSDGLSLAIQRAVQDNAASILNVSFGNCEANIGNNGNQLYQFLYEQAAAQGISVTASTGDSGSAGCDDPNLFTVAQQGLAVSGLASTPFNIAVGGTDYVDLLNNFSTYANPTNDPTNGRSALSYIPERPWNNSPVSNGALASNTPFKDSNGLTNIVAAGGGASSCIQLDASNRCLGGYTKPTWQSAVAPNNTTRVLPDVSLLAANGSYSATWAVCAAPHFQKDANGNDTTTVLTDCNPPDSNGRFNLSGFGGTSTAAPAFAGMLALVEQSVGHRLGQANTVLYKLAQTAPSVFHDITNGNISVVCSGGAAANCASNGFLIGYDAIAGYDLASGLGSVDATAMVANWSKGALSPSATSLTLSPTSFVHGTAVSITGAVTGSGTTPTGDVAIVTNNPAPNAGGQTGFTLDNSGKYTATGSNAYSFFPGGTYTVTANYGGDSIFAGSTSPGTSITVTPEDSTLQLSVSGAQGNTSLVNVANMSIPFGTLLAVDAIPYGVSQKNQTNPSAVGTGSVTFTDNSAIIGGGPIEIASKGAAEIPCVSAGKCDVATTYYNTSVGNHSIAASYSGDLSYRASSAGPIAFAVTKALTSMQLSTSGGSATLQAVVIPTPASAAVAPTQTITFTDTSNSAVLATLPAQPAQDPTTGATLAFATLTVDTTKLASGTNNITATYSGDANYAASPASNAVQLIGAGASPNLALTTAPASITISRGKSGSTTITVTPVNGFTGSVALTCAITQAPTGAQNLPTCATTAPPSIGGTVGVTSTVTVSTTASTSGARRLSGLLASGGGAVLACILFLGVPARRRNWGAMLALLVFVGFAAGVGCGGGGGGGGGTTGGGGGGNPGTTAGNYTATVTATSGAITQSTNIAVTVN